MCGGLKNFAAMSSWAILHEAVVLKSCEETLHLPFMDIAGPMPRAGKLGVLLVSSRHGAVQESPGAWGVPLLEMPKLMRK
jgi:hypothetical protein